MEKEINKEYLRELFAIYKDASLSRFRLLPEISSLATALLIVGTFNHELLPLTSDVKLAISILLLLIPFSLFMYLSGANEAAIAAAKEIDKVVPGFSDVGSQSVHEIIIGRLSLKKKISSLYSWVVVIFIFIFVLLFIYHIWN